MSKPEFENRKGNKGLRDLDADGRIILKPIVNKSHIRTRIKSCVYIYSPLVHSGHHSDSLSGFQNRAKFLD
jgi:hypothetical protein